MRTPKDRDRAGGGRAGGGRAGGESGMAMILALIMSTVVIAGSIAAVSISFGSLSQTAAARKLVETGDAASAGLQAEINNVRTGTSSYVACPAGPQVVTEPNNPATSTTAVGAAGDAGPGQTASYTLEVASGSTETGLAGALAPCDTKGWFALTGPSPWFVLIQSAGTTNSALPVTRTVQSMVEVTGGSAPTTTTALSTTTTVPGPVYGQSGNFTEALYGLVSLQAGTSDSFTLTDQSGDKSANAFTTGVLNCTSDFTYQGNVRAYQTSPPVPEEASGACNIASSLFVQGNLDLTAGASIGANVYTTGSALLDGGLNVSGSVYANGPVTIQRGAVVNGNVYANGAVVMSGGSKVAGNLYATGGVTLSGSASVGGSIESSGGSISYSGTANSNSAYTAGQAITPCPKASAGPKSCAYSLPADFPASSVYPTVANEPPAPPFPTLDLNTAAWEAGGYTVVTNDNCAADKGNGLDPAGVYQTIVTAASSGTPTVVQTSCQIIWGDDYRKGYSIPTSNDLAIFADGGIDFTRAMNSVASGNGTSHDLYLVVPSSAPPQAGGGNCPSHASDTNPADNVGNVVLAQPIDASSPSGGPKASWLHDFVYSPNSVCASASSNIYGKVYAGGSFDSQGTYVQPYCSAAAAGTPCTVASISPFDQVGGSIPTTTTTTVAPPPTDTTSASTEALDVDLLNGALVIATPSAQATDTGSGPNVTAQVQPALSLLGGETFLTAGALSEYAEADTNGPSYGCAGLVQAGGIVQLGAGKTSCTNSGSGSGGLTLDISNIPGLGSLLSSVADITVNVNAATAYATENADGTAGSGSATLAGATVTVKLVGGLLNLGPFAITINPAANQNLLAAVIAGITGQENFLNKVLLGPVVTLLSNTIAPLLTLQTNYQTTSTGQISVSALHVGLIGTTATVDVAKVTAGPNGVNPSPPTTTTTSVPATTTTTVPALLSGNVEVVWYKVVPSS